MEFWYNTFSADMCASLADRGIFFTATFDFAFAAVKTSSLFVARACFVVGHDIDVI
jgi:hypothetical protein